MTEPRPWPADRPPAPDEAVAARCAACGLAWRVHRDLAGGRLACECGAYVDVPAARPALELPLHRLESTPAALALAAREHEPEDVEHEVDALERPASVGEQQRFTTRALVELVLLGLAFLAPWVVLNLAVEARLAGLLLPVAGLATGLLVLLVGAFTQGVAFSGLAGARARYFAEAALVVAPLVGIAWLFDRLFTSMGLSGAELITEIRDALGPAMALFVVALVPGVFEELAFRGVLHARCRQLFGPGGWVLAAGAFAVAHGAQPFLIVHFLLGLYLGRLRDRSRSLLPGMVTHVLYNGSIVLLF